MRAPLRIDSVFINNEPNRLIIRQAGPGCGWGRPTLADCGPDTPENWKRARVFVEAPAMLEALRRVAEALGNGATINDRKNSVYGDMLRAILARIDGPTTEGEEA